MIPLIGLAHGSRHQGVRPAIDRLLAAVTAAHGIPTQAAYLDLAEPDLTSAAVGLAAQGHRSAVVVPLLFTSAFHATVDVPVAIAAASATSGVELSTSPVLGTGPEVEELLRQVMADAGVDSGHSVLLYAVGSSDAAANDAVHDLARRMTAGRRGQTRVGFGTAGPRAQDVLGELAEPIAIVPLFLAPGLLLDPMVTLAAQRGWVMTPPLAERAAALVALRYRDHAAVIASLD